ncbi:MAG: hypothetical protein EKK57_05035 [Proteobacteria bacterium]|nr:MAG: hypothetical protein EKK57_05035 [Pseudomonadota bacterium]
MKLLPKILLILISVSLLTGCTITRIEVGDKKFVTYRFFDWTKVGGISVMYPPHGGTNDIKITINDYHSDREKALQDIAPIVESITEGIVKGAAKSVVPIP